MIVPVILSGGSGTRLWPLSRKLYPKQFIKLVNNKSENTIEAKIEIVEDFGNYKLITVNTNNLIIKAKVERETAIPQDVVLLNIPAEHCCIYQNKHLI